MTGTDSGSDETRRDRLEDLFAYGAGAGDALAEAMSYEPVMYKLVKEIDLKNQVDESPADLQKNFLDRTERLLRHH